MARPGGCAAETTKRCAHRGTVLCKPEECVHNCSEGRADGSSAQSPHSRLSLQTHLSRILLSLAQIQFILLPGFALIIHNESILMRTGCKQADQK